jgi:putative photosynthetic complex assembly protein 2
MTGLEILAAFTFTVFAWWFCTGVIFYLDGLPQRTYWISLGIATFVATCALIGLIAASRVATVASAYCAFSCALLVWGWQEMLFLMGAVSGSSRDSCPNDVSEAVRFRCAVRAVIHHELALFGGGVLVAALSWGAPNQVGLATYCVLWLMRLSAKLNLFLGVRNTYAHLLPAHLAYLGTYFRQRTTISRFFLGSTVFATLVTVLLWLHISFADASQFVQTGTALVAAMMTLAVVEHLFLVLPIPMEKLWAAALAKRRPQAHQATLRMPLSVKATSTLAAPDLTSPVK